MPISAADIPHPARLTERLGVTETPAAIGVGVVMTLQYVFLARLWQGFPLKAADYLLHVNVIIVGIALSVVGGAGIVSVMLLRWRRRTAAARRLEKPASDKSFDGIRGALAEVSTRSTLRAPPQLFYSSRNAYALEVRDADRRQPGTVVVGLGQRKEQEQAPLAFAAKLGHEVSHLELGSTAMETTVRRAVAVHFAVLGWLVLVFLLILGFIDPRGIDRAAAWKLMPVFDRGIYASMSYHLVVMAMSSLVVLVYSYYFLVRREHLHDVRGSQLTGSAILAESVFQDDPTWRSRFKAVKDFVQLHPPLGVRRRVVLQRDFILISAVLYPLIVAASLPLTLLLMTGWDDVLGIERPWWNLALTTAAGTILYLILSADISRLGMVMLVRKRSLLALPVYAVCAGAATQIPRIAMEVVYGLRKDLPSELVVARIWTGIMEGSGKIALMLALLLLAAMYLAAVRIATDGESGDDKHAAVLHAINGVATVGAFTVASLTSVGFIVPTLVLALAVMLAGVVYFCLAARCARCECRRAGVLMLRTRCRCDGHEHLPLVRQWVEQPYEEHLVRRW